VAAAGGDAERRPPRRAPREATGRKASGKK